jgi:hypothetical protein
MSFLLLIILLYLSLKNQSGPEPVAEEIYDTSPPSGVPVDRLLSIPLLSTHATAPDSRVEYLFDQKPETCWLLARGSGPGECLEINFLPETMPFLSGIRILPATADTLAAVRKIALYVNNELAQVREGAFNFPLGQKVFALRLCIESTDADEEYSYREDNQLIHIHTLPSGAQTGLESILFFDQDGEAYYPLPPRYIPANVAPSSNLNPVSAFHAGQLFDGDPGSAWIEGESATSAGSFLRIDLAEIIQPSFIALWNGFQLSDQHFQHNSRVAAMTIQADNAPDFSFECRDQTGGQLIPLPGNQQLSSFTLRIDRTYRGDRYAEAALSELFFLDGAQPILLQTDWPQRTQRQIVESTAPSPLRLYLNRPVANRIEHSSGAYYRRKNLYIAGDGRFYAQIEQNEPNRQSVTRYDISGHWELQEALEDRCRLRLFGRSERIDFNANTTPDFQEDLFNEVITLQTDRIDGGEILGRFYRR